MTGRFKARRRRKRVNGLAIQALEITRDTFAATHWIRSSLYSTVDVPVYAGVGPERRFEGWEKKKVWCAVGGFCNTMLDLAGVPDEIKERAESAGLFNPYQANQQGFFLDFKLDDEVFEATLLAESMLYRAIVDKHPELADRYPGESPQVIESTVISWNDGVAQDAEAVVAMFNYAIELGRVRR